MYVIRKIRGAYFKFKRFCELPKNKWPRKLLIKKMMLGYRNSMGEDFDLLNPQTFTQKIQWYKIFFRREGLVRIVDKVLFKEYVAEHLGEGYTIPLYGAWSSIRALKKDWDSLPEEICLKSTVSSEGKGIKIIHKRSEVNFRELAKELKPCFQVKNTLIDSYCGAYYKAKPRILAEQYMEQVDEQLYDYKFFCFDGKPYCIYVAVDHLTPEGSIISFYDLEWNRLDVTYGRHRTGTVEKPKHFDEMLAVAEKLSQGFPFVRVDFFDTEEKMYVAEMTLYPGGGLTPYHPESFNRELGDQFILPRNEVK